MKINVYGTESYVTWLVREPIEIDTDNYPELEGKTEEEVKEYIRENYWEMKPTDDVYDDLGEELQQMDLRRDKIYNEETGVIFDNE